MIEIPPNKAGVVNVPVAAVPAAPQGEKDNRCSIESPCDIICDTEKDSDSNPVTPSFPWFQEKSEEVEVAVKSVEFVPVTFKNIVIKHGGFYYQVTVPNGWRYQHTYNTLLVYDPHDRNICVSFMWASGAGTADPASLIQKTVEHNNIENYQVLYSTPVEVIDTPPGVSRKMEQEATFTYRRQKCHHHVAASVYDSNDPYYLFWGGTMIWRQAPDEKWDDYNNTLYNVASSFTKRRPPKPEATDCGCGHGGGCACQQGIIHGVDG